MYIDVQHQGILLRGLIIGEARDLGPWLIRVGSLVPVRDRLVDYFFHGRTEHIPVEHPVEGGQVAEQVEPESVDSSKAEVEDPGATMVVYCNMTTDCFLRGGQPVMQQAPSTPPPEAERGHVPPIRPQGDSRTFLPEFLLP